MQTLESNCIFCKIIQGEAPGDVIYQDENLICIKDIRPASTHHYLIIPKTHIPNAKQLQKSDEETFDKMTSIVETICQQQNLDKESVRTGFHWPPFTTVNHLHLHIISPVKNMGLIHKAMFKPNSWWFVSVDYVKSRFSSMTS